jgi:hypothetical protein
LHHAQPIAGALQMTFAPAWAKRFSFQTNTLPPTLSLSLSIDPFHANRRTRHPW